MKDIHETQSTEQLHHSDDKTFAPIEDLQRITGGVWNRKSFGSIHSRKELDGLGML
ncbi:hypothetical protein SAMN05192569_100948 [Parageobacillus thermantarcticus]|uniref:Uncharacterized protein n=1 Tax=Parageobacillus thermantarcticus TaxID=186116 RepID=A0A1I0T2R8_9BACL|nr:hypothetical protein [Parageobacillus thermantarcticus]SFA45326.1 hypothetical protein SAMN05192569_100948 [Parageobacillus thermantarcticus]